MALVELHFVDTWNVWNIAATIAAIGSAIVTAIMAYYTRKTVQQGEKQLTELKSQRVADKEKWEAENRPWLEIVPLLPSNCSYGEGLSIMIKNIGNKTAKQVHIDLDENFIKAFQCNKVEEQVDWIKGKTFRVLPNSYKILSLCRMRKYEIDYETHETNETVFGRTVENGTYDRIKNHLKQFSFHVKCQYEGHSFEDDLTNREIEYEQSNYLIHIPDISYSISDIRESIEIIADSLENKNNKES